MVIKFKYPIIGWVKGILGKYKDWMYNIRLSFMEKWKEQ